MSDYAFTYTGSANCRDLTGKRSFEPFVIKTSSTGTDNNIVLYLGKIPQSTEGSEKSTELIVSQSFKINDEIPQQIISGGWGSVKLREYDSSTEAIPHITISDSNMISNKMTITYTSTSTDSLCLFPVVFEDKLGSYKKKVSIKLYSDPEKDGSYTALSYNDWKNAFKPHLYGYNSYTTDSGFSVSASNSTLLEATTSDKALQNFYLFCSTGNSFLQTIGNLRIEITIEKIVSAK